MGCAAELVQPSLEEGFGLPVVEALQAYPNNAATAIELHGMDGSRSRVRTPAGELVLELPLPGLYNVYNALAAVTACLRLGVAPERIAAGLAIFGAGNPFGWRISVAVCGILLVLLRPLIDRFSHFVGVEEGTSVLFALGILFLIVVSMYLSVHITALEDKVACLHVIIKRVRERDKASATVTRVCDEIDSLFGPENARKPAVTFSTIHKSKGREWKRVVWLETGASPWARKAWEITQEANLCYVAATRAKAELVLVPAK